MFKIGDIVRRRGEEETGTIISIAGVFDQRDGSCISVEYYKVLYGENTLRWLTPKALLEAHEPTRFSGKG